MRFLVLALMIALLPLRSWAGDAMAVEAAAPALGGPAPAGQAAMDDCHQNHGQAAGHAMGHEAAPADTTQDEHTGADCGTCTACQICHSVALTAVLPQALAPVLPAAAPRSSQPRYASAAPAPGLKPPIS